MWGKKIRNFWLRIEQFIEPKVQGNDVSVCRIKKYVLKNTPQQLLISIYFGGGKCTSETDIALKFIFENYGVKF